ncbi:hypothetical protein HA466_0145120 [Hirschfeldia incana]|nr:hypothetical protein HA466_0145120 [Hirschfeldia incana]KAJ0248942.1 hypothetical protein HA466_0145120 [Hirschfeldia incana]
MSYHSSSSSSTTFHHLCRLLSLQLLIHIWRYGGAHDHLRYGGAHDSPPNFAATQPSYRGSPSPSVFSPIVINVAAPSRYLIFRIQCIWICVDKKHN